MCHLRFPLQSGIFPLYPFQQLFPFLCLLAAGHFGLFFFFSSILMKVKEESKKTGLKLNIQKTKILASGPITSWQIDGETMETVRAFIFLGSKITADGDCSHEIKRRLLFGRKTMTNLDSILKRRDITLPTKVCIGKAMIFPVVRYGNESWTIKKAELSYQIEELVLLNYDVGEDS